VGNRRNGFSGDNGQGALFVPRGALEVASPSEPCADGTTYSHALDHARLALQRVAVRAAMAGSVWRSLADLAALTGHPEASISARLRDLRKARFGGLTVDRRRRTIGTWEYRVTPQGGD
jgi:hypothetical protein